MVNQSPTREQSYWFSQSQTGFAIGIGDSEIAHANNREHAEMIVKALKLANWLSFHDDVTLPHTPHMQEFLNGKFSGPPAERDE